MLPIVQGSIEMAAIDAVAWAKSMTKLTTPIRDIFLIRRRVNIVWSVASTFVAFVRLDSAY